ncbi:PREDICTED: uncharacterized protein LOC109116754 [Tarenaya hassleriana]|uniref:uncharacterized protein LOC109116754 n=1 Tax=Tarenaya hassleriana TaxID=28532 RepID=UPI0008FD2C04|nr:PREDICTED: uncharacterized protein LOC109116754 [Tarenaya hassleriana]
MATSSGTLPSDNVTPHNPADPASTLINVNVSNVSKLDGTNYITWSIQLQALLEGYNRESYLDQTTAPASTVITNDTITPNPMYTPWHRQDRLVFSALLGSISPACQALVATSSSSAAAWKSLADTYGRSSHGHVKQIKEQLRRHNKGAKSIDEYMRFFKIKADELALLGKPMDHEDLVDLILVGLGDEYKAVKDAVHARDTSISFIELHEMLIWLSLNHRIFRSPPMLHTPVAVPLSVLAVADNTQPTIIGCHLLRQTLSRTRADLLGPTLENANCVAPKVIVQGLVTFSQHRSPGPPISSRLHHRTSLHGVPQLITRLYLLHNLHHHGYLIPVHPIM